MKKSLLSIIFIGVFFIANCQNFTLINDKSPQESSISIISENENEITLKLSVNAYKLSEVETPNGIEMVVTAPNGINFTEKGNPDIPFFTTSINIPSKGKAVTEIIDAKHITIENISIAPSKGSIKRNVDPKTVPYEYGKCYSRNAFTPEIEANNSAEFCIRDMRGTSVRFFPFQYNPVAKQLKIYTEITAKVRFTKQQGENEIESNFTKIDEFEHIYARTFINYPKGKRYTQVQDGHPGRMLVVCADAYQEAMGDFISWKREKGIVTEMALMSEIGTTSANLKTFIQNYFSSHDDLAYILLVGDGGAVPSIISGSAYEPETSDNKYVYLVGDDHYADVFIGRFSGESVEDIENQVRKVINYEKELTDEATWLTNAYGSASREGGGSSGHDQGYGAESDMVHTGYIQTKLENYGYTVTRVNQNSNYGYTSDVAATTAAFNNGIGVACYIGHGDYDRWYSTGYTISHVNALTNEYRLPFVISVACYNGEFVNKNCFGETWMRATNEGNPTGAIVFLGSSIAQDWNPPMTAQDEMIDIIVESDENNIKRTIGGITFNGYFKMIQDYPTSTNEGDGPTTADTWVVFGDPSTMFRSKTPENMSISHSETQIVGQTEFSVTCDAEDALATLSMASNGETLILGSAYIHNGTANIIHEAVNHPGDITLTVTAYNKITYQSNINLIVPNGPYVVNEHNGITDIRGNNNGLADNNETIKIHHTLKNVGTEVANNVSMSISSDNPKVSIINDSVMFGDINPNESSYQYNAFEFDILDGIEDQTNIEFIYTIYDGDTHGGSFNIMANAPQLKAEFVSIDDNEGGNGNSRLDAGETVKIIAEISNTGHNASVAGEAILTSPNPEISFTNGYAEIGIINAGESQLVEFEITISENVINGSALNLNIAATAGMYNTIINKAFSVGLQIETWESNTFTQFQWENSSPIPWTIVSSGAYEGQYCAKSGRIGHSSQTHLSITLNVLNNDSISFYKKVSCETPGNNWTGIGLSYYDYFSFSIDNQLLGQWAGESDWQLVTYPVSEGEHTFVWSYVKDYSDNGGSDCAWIDNITLPAYALDSAIININTPIVMEELNIYPNPANETAFLNINLAESCNVSILVFNSNGQVVKEISEDLMSGENYIQINTSPLQNGFYIVKTFLNNKVISKNLTIMR